MPKKFTEYEIKHFYNLYTSGKSIKQICTEYQVSKSSLYSWVQQFSKTKKVDSLVYNGRDIYQLQKEVERLRRENEIYRTSGCTPQTSLDVKLSIMKDLTTQFSVHSLCNALEVRRSTLYHFMLRKPEKTVYQINDELLKPAILEVFEQSMQRFGADKIRIKLMELGFTVGPNKISKLMKEMNLSCQSQKPSRWTNNLYKNGYRKNKLNRNFSQPDPNLVWVSDFTHINIGTISHFICVIIDLFSRKVLAYGITESADTKFLIEVFDTAYKLRGRPQTLMFHSDQGAQFTSYEFRKYLKKINVNQSFSKPGVPYDNAVAERFFASLKKEELHRRVYDTIEELENSVSEYIDFFNNERPHQRLGMRTPNQVETDYYNSL